MTLDLNTGKAYPHRREDYMTKITAVAADEDCAIPLWTAFLDTVTAGDKELQSYLQRVAGYCMTGVTTEHALFFLYGTGANGKSVFLNTLRGIWGSYAAVASMTTFIETRYEQHPTDLAMLVGVRMVITQEVERGQITDRRQSQAVAPLRQRSNPPALSPDPVRRHHPAGAARQGSAREA